MDPAAQAFVDEFGPLHERLRKAVREIDESLLDRNFGPDTNSVAVMAVHTCGSQLDWLRLGAGRLGERDRDAEFRTRGRDAVDLLAEIERVAHATPELVEAAVRDGLETKRRHRDGREFTAAHCVLHALKHTAEHVGQMELTRQLVERTDG